MRRSLVTAIALLLALNVSSQTRFWATWGTGLSLAPGLDVRHAGTLRINRHIISVERKYHLYFNDTYTDARKNPQDVLFTANYGRIIHESNWLQIYPFIGAGYTQSDSSFIDTTSIHNYEYYKTFHKGPCLQYGIEVMVRRYRFVGISATLNVMHAFGYRTYLTGMINLEIGFIRRKGEFESQQNQGQNPMK